MKSVEHEESRRRRKQEADELMCSLSEKRISSYANPKLWLVLVVALLMLFSTSLSRAFVHGLSILPHELGHTVAAWMLGNPATPIFSTMGFYVVAIKTWLWFKLLVFGFWCFLIYQWNRFHQYLRLKSLVFLFLMLLLIFIPIMRDMVISLMGTGGEILAAFVFCDWALSPHRKIAEWKRYVYLVMGAALYVNVFLFTGKLCFDAAFMEFYLQGAGLDGITNDLYAIELSTGVSIKIQAVGLASMALLSMFLLWRLCRLPDNYLREWGEKIKQIPPFSNFLELKKRSKKIF